MTRTLTYNLYRHLFLLSLLATVAACKPSTGDSTLQLNGQTMGTYYRITLTDLPSGVQPKILENAITKRLEDANNLLSTYREHSELSRFNRTRHTDWVNISKELLTVIIKAKRLSELSNGAFDATVGPLVNLWGFGPGSSENRIPEAQQIEALKKYIGYQKLEVDIPHARIRKTQGGLYLDLSALGEGYGIDQIAAYLETQGIYNYLVEIGGDMKAHGHNQDGKPWKIAIENPANTTDPAAQRAMQITAAGIGTSGSYRNFFSVDGKHYSHIIDPHTGYPVTHTAVSVTVIQPTAIDADGLSTMLLAMGPDQGFKIANRLNIPALFITHADKKFQTRITPAFKRYQISP